MTVIAVAWSDYDKFGCITCGCEYCYSLGMSGGGTSPVKCGQCDERFIILTDGIDKSSFGFGQPTIYPELQSHPRKGRPKHEYIRPDVKPDSGGEYWNPRGVGYDLSGFVESKKAGERVIQMLTEIIGREPKSWLDYRKHEPDWIQVKIQEDGFDLEKLCVLCSEDGIITIDRLKETRTVIKNRAIKWEPEKMLAAEVLNYFNGLEGMKARSISRFSDCLIVKLESGELTVNSGEWIVKDDNGNLYTTMNL